MGLGELLTVKETALRLKTSRVQIRRMIQSEDLAAVRVGREYRIPLVYLQEFIKQNLTVWEVFLMNTTNSTNEFRIARTLLRSSSFDDDIKK